MFYTEAVTEDDVRDHVYRARAQGSDDARVEVKAAGHALPKSLWDSVSAFANTDGGVIVLGLDEKSGFAPADGFDSGRIIDAFVSGMSNDPKVDPVPNYRIVRTIIDGASIVGIEIDSIRQAKGLVLPCYVTSKGRQNGSFIRVDDHDQRMSDYAVYLMHAQSIAETVDDTAVPGVAVEDLSEALVAGVLKLKRAQGSRAFEGLERDDVAGQLTRLSIMDRQGQVTFAGYLVVGAYPQQEFPQLYVDVAVHPTVEKSSDPTVRFVDRVMCEGPIPLMVSDAVEAVAKNLRRAREVRGTAGIDVLEIPEDVLREAITNAVTHRDYSVRSRGQQVQVDVFPDRVEVTNPGGFTGTVTLEEAASGVSDARNPLLAKLLLATPRITDSGTVSENQGSGIPRMLAAMRERGLREPDFSASTLTQAVVKIYRSREEQLEAPETTPALGVPGGATRVQGSRNGESERVRDLTPSEKAVLAALSVRKERTIRELADLTGKSLPALRGLLRGLVTDGVVVATAPPSSRSRAYRKAE